MDKKIQFVVVEMATLSVFGFPNEDETPEEAVKRAEEYYISQLGRLVDLATQYDDPYWQQRVTEVAKQVESGCKYMEYSEFQKIQREKLLSGELKEVSKEEYDNALNVLPPEYYVERNGIIMFCMSERYTETYTAQYAYDRKEKKYYVKTVDMMDSSTWIDEILKEKKGA